jgi:hypothetical protein
MKFSLEKIFRHCESAKRGKQSIVTGIRTSLPGKLCFTRFFLVTACGSLISGPAYSACTGPAGDEGAMFYNSSEKVFQF